MGSDRCNEPVAPSTPHFLFVCDVAATMLIVIVIMANNPDRHEFEDKRGMMGPTRVLDVRACDSMESSYHVVAMCRIAHRLLLKFVSHFRYRCDGL
jgi:hypothetical protein